MNQRRMDHVAPVRRAVSLAAMFALSLLSCGREITGPENGVVRIASGLSFVSEFPGELAALEDGAGSVVAFDRVRVLFRRADGSVAFDEVVNFPAGTTELSLSLSITLSNSAPATGEPLSLFLRYINASGDTVFAGGPVAVVAVPRAPNDPLPTPAQVPLTYTGPGAQATTVAFTQDTITVIAGDPFTFTATARDASESVVADAPLVFGVLDAAHATLTATSAGAGTALAARGTARVRVALAAGGAADTAHLVVQPKAGSLEVLAGNNQSAGIGVALTDSVAVRVLATDNQPMAGVQVAISVASGGGTVSADTLTSGADGIVRFAWTLGSAVGAQTLSVSSAGLASVTVTATGTDTGPSLLAFTSQPSGTPIAGALLPPIVVEVRTASNALVTAYTDSVTIALGQTPGEAGFDGRLRVAAVGGVATFDSLYLYTAGEYTLTVSAAGLTGATTAPFTVAHAAASQFAIVQGDGQAAAPGATLATPIIVSLHDEFGNPIPAATIAFVAGVGASATPDTTQTVTNGTASSTWTLADTAGAQHLVVRAVGTGLDSLVVTANGSVGPIATTDVTPDLDTLVSIGETQALSATSADVALNPIVGAYTWVSRAPAIATVDSTGVVTAVAPGATWVVATESGGTADSARIVVDQQLSSVAVTPLSKQIYLGTTFQFAAQAVDGLGVALVAQPTFVWSTQSTGIALADSTGLVTGVGLGSTQVRAEAGGIQGVATVTVSTPITRIAVIRDSIGFVTTDTFTVEALGRTRSYRAVAYDTLDAPMTGVSFTWESTNPSVAMLDSTGTETARAAAVANGTTSIRASAQGVLGAASLKVQQRLAAIDLTPDSATIGAFGNTLIIARGLDPDGSYLATLTGVTFVSTNTPVATVNASSGLVTGVANGTALIYATKDTITSDTTVITVGGAVPAIISFGKDTLSIGRSASVSIPIYLSKPHTSAVTVNLAVADTFAYFTQASITIAAGATSGNATLNGNNAGVTAVYATDGGGGGSYAGDTASLRVQASVRLSNTSYSLVATNELSTQIILTDPAPAGGTYITYEYGTPGRASVSPDPAFIPAGQLSANVVLQGLTAGTTTVIPASTGVSGQSSTVTVYAASLDLQPTTLRLGKDQYHTNQYVQVPSYLNQPLNVSLTSTDSTIASTVPNVVIGGGQYYTYFDVAGRTIGSAYLHSTATGFTKDSMLVIVTTPRLDVCCNATRTTTSPPVNFSITIEDSTGNSHPRLSPLVINASSSDTSIIKLSAATVVVSAGQSQTSALTYEPGGEIGTAWIHVSAPGHFSDSILITVNGPKLSFSFSTARVGLGQRINGVYASIPDYTAQARTVYITNSDTTIATLPDSVIIPAGSYYQYFDLLGIGLGQVTLIASTAGHEPDTATFRVTTPRLSLSGGGTVDNFRPPVNITTTVQDSVGSSHARIDSLTVNYVSTDTTILTVTPTAVILPGSSSTGTAQVSFHAVGTASIIVSAPGHGADTITYTVRVPKLSLSFSSYRIGRRQYAHPTSFYVSVPNNVPTQLPVTLTQTNAASDSLSTTNPDIPAGTYYQYFGLAGLQTGVDTIIASAPDYLPDTAIVTVTSTRLSVSNLPTSRTTTSPPSSVSITAVDSVGSSHTSLDTIVVSLASTNSAVAQPITGSVRILPGASSVNAQVAYVGPGTAALIVADSLNSGYAGDTTSTVTVTGPSLSLYNGTPKLGMRQNGGSSAAYVYVPDNIAGSPLVVHLASTDPSVASVPDSVIIPVGTYYAYFTVVAHDVVGTIQINATAAGYGPASVNQEVTAPRFVMSTSSTVRTTQTPPTITVWAADADGNTHFVNENVVVTLASSSEAIGVVDSATVTIAVGQTGNSTAHFVPLSQGTTQLSATDARTASYKYSGTTANVQVVLPELSAWSSPFSLGIGQYSPQWVYTQDYRLTPLLVNLAHVNANSTTPDTLYINVSNYYREFRLSGSSSGVDTITFTAPGHVSVKSPVTVGLGRVDGIGNWQATLNADSVQVTLYTRAPNSDTRNVLANTTFNLSADAHLQFVSGGASSVPITSVVVPADAYFVSFWVKRLSAGVANVSITNANYTPYNTTVVVNP